ncbi:MAG TPA: hypothetical protein VF545_13555 [Thermoleophilaceae bacterium]|jgi:hypothetical protein
MEAQVTPGRTAAGASPARFLARHWLAVLLAAAGVLATAYTAWRLRERYVGDAAIYLSYARNAADGHPFQFNVGDFSSGSTSPLWSLLLAVPYLFGLGIGGAQAFAAAFAALAFLATLLAARRVSRSWTAASVASLFVLGTMTTYAISLFESGLVVTLCALAVLAGVRVAEGWTDEGLSPRTLAPLVAVWAALPLARPDAVLLVIAQAGTLFAFAPAGRRRAAPLLLAALAVAAIPSAAYFGYSLVELGTPSTSSQERAFALQEVAPHWIGPFYRSSVAIRDVVASPWVFGVVPALGGLVLLWRRRSARWLAVYCAAGLAGYIALLTFVAPTFIENTRYLLPVVPLVAVGAAYLLARARGTALWLPALLAGLLAIGGSAALELRDRTDVLRSFDITKDEVFERDVTTRIDRLAKPGDVVLSYEVQLRYFLRDDLEVLSSDGITDGRVRQYQDGPDLTAFLRRYKPRWWIADQNTLARRFMRDSVLSRALLAFRADPGLRSAAFEGIRFDVIARRRRPLPRGFGGWQMLFRLAYPTGQPG